MQNATVIGSLIKLFILQYNDVAILTLANCANTQSNYAKPICLPTGDNTFVNEKVTVAGWGALSSGNLNHNKFSF